MPIAGHSSKVPDGCIADIACGDRSASGGGQYYGPDGKNERKGYPVIVSSSPESHDEETARGLWERSEN